MLKENGILVTTQAPAKLNKKPRNVEHRTLNVHHRILYSVIKKKIGRANCLSKFYFLQITALALFVFIKLGNAQRHRYWMFDVERSMFDVQSFGALKRRSFIREFS